MKVTCTELHEEMKVKDTERKISDKKSLHENKHNTLQRPAGKVYMKMTSR
jgi:hypothetical protein